jgi:hypothetical protein
MPQVEDLVDRSSSEKELGLRVSAVRGSTRSVTPSHSRLIDLLMALRIYEGQGYLCDSSGYHRAHRVRKSMTLMAARGMYKNAT